MKCSCGVSHKTKSDQKRNHEVRSSIKERNLYRASIQQRLDDKNKVELSGNFAEFIRNVSFVNEMDINKVWNMWKYHQRQNDVSDQGATRIEFILWNKLKDPDAFFKKVA